jgi:hypothetical protein
MRVGDMVRNTNFLKEGFSFSYSPPGLHGNYFSIKFVIQQDFGNSKKL